jgi:hypothetical protein
VGRGESFYAYNGFTRNLSFSFKIAPQTRQEMRPLYRKLNYLVSQLYPDYQSFIRTNGNNLGNGFMRAPITRLTIGDYIVRQPGFFTAMNITIPDDSPWEIAVNDTLDGDMYELPHVLEVSCQFTPIHDFLARRSWVPSGNEAGNTNTGNINITPLITPNVETSTVPLVTVDANGKKSIQTIGIQGNKFGVGKNSQYGTQEYKDLPESSKSIVPPVTATNTPVVTTDKITGNFQSAFNV